MIELTEEERVRYGLYKDFTKFAALCLKIRTKDGAIEPLKLNRAQLYINSRLDEQRRQTGRVRAFVLKGRQQGCSTLIAARYYWRVIHSIGYKVFILSHLADATKSLFRMVKRYHDLMPDAMRPLTESDSAKELVFSDLDSGYAVGTARSTGSGRGETIQLFHGSEVAFWESAEENASGILQTIPDADGTEVIMESTANGVGNYFHKRCMEALKGAGGYQLIFVPFYWQPEYSLPTPEGFKLDDEELELKRIYSVSDECLYWRRGKIKELGGLWRFKQEYPFTVDEAFQSGGRESFISPEVVERARGIKYVANDHAPAVLGVDPALGGDRTSFVVRKGQGVIHVESMEKLQDFGPTIGRIKQLIGEFNLKHIFIDKIGIGYGVVDTLNREGYSHMVTGVNVALPSIYPDKYANKRAEIWDAMRKWLEEGGVIPDRQSLVTDLLAPAAGPESIDYQGRLKIQSKENIKDDGFQSPDEADALSLTFAHTVLGGDFPGSLGKSYASQRRMKLSIV